ncbi:MAG: AAA family ATPase [Candidatus Sumerlaeaceae bacterium]|jgi:MoxR-like ATPase
MMSNNEKNPAARNAIQKVAENVARVIRGKDDVIELVLAALLAGGHVLLEDVPGVGKTTLAKSLARSLHADFRRVQFTPDLLPSDITGTNIYRADEHRFEFRHGPIFTNILLADELNRATPRTQSSLLEAMEERQVSADGNTYPLPAFFFVIATQNPVEQEGVYSLPEAQLDRFLMQVALGYPSRADEAALVRERLSHDPFFDLSPVASGDDVLAAQRELVLIHVDATVLNYTLSLVEATRRHEEILLGASPRATLALIAAARALAYLRSRNYVLPDDIKELAVPVLSHRLILQSRALIAGRRPEEVLREILNHVPVPLRGPDD